MLEYLFSNRDPRFSYYITKFIKITSPRFLRIQNTGHTMISKHIAILLGEHGFGDHRMQATEVKVPIIATLWRRNQRFSTSTQNTLGF